MRNRETISQNFEQKLRAQELLTDFKPLISPEELEKSWRFFRETTPAGNSITGFTSRRKDEYYGALALAQVNQERFPQVIMSMPKIRYPYYEGELRLPLHKGITDARFTEKIDGTALIFYPLRNKDGEVIEVVPKSRLTPVLKTNKFRDWGRLISRVRTPAIDKLVRQHQVTLAGELWGRDNPHLVDYQEPLHYSIHTIVKDKKVVSPRLLSSLAKPHKLEMVPTVQTLPLSEEKIKEAYLKLQKQMEQENQEMPTGTYKHEGAILVLSSPNNARYFKCKPRSIEEIHMSGGGFLNKNLLWHELFRFAEDLGAEDFTPQAFLTYLKQEGYQDSALGRNKSFINENFFEFKAKYLK